MDKTNFRMAVTIIFFAFLILPGFRGRLHSQTTEPAGPLQHTSRFYVGSDSTVYVPQQLPISLYIGTPSDTGRQPIRLFPDAQSPQADSLFLPEGANSFRIPSRTGEPVPFRIAADGTAPASSISFNATQRSDEAGLPHFTSDLSISLSAQDAISGVRNVYYSIDGKPFRKYGEKLTRFTSNAHHSLRYYAVDNVGNAERINTNRFVVDNTPPATKFVVEGIHKRNILSPWSSIRLVSRDSLAGVRKVYFKIDDNTFAQYADSIVVDTLSDGQHTVTYYSMDSVGNRQAEQTREIFFDSAPPTVSADITGDELQSEEVTYVSSRSRIRFTALDNQAGIQSVKYQMDESNELTYEKPFSFYSTSGAHTITYYAVDSVENSSATGSLERYTDLTPPETAHRFDGQVFQNGDTLLITPDTEISLNATDMESGIQKIRYQVDSTEFSTYANPFTIKSEGYHSLRYFSIDNVNNREDEHRVHIRVQQTMLASSRSVSPVVKGDKQYHAADDNSLYVAKSLPVYLHISSSPDGSENGYLLESANASQYSNPMYFDDEGKNTFTLTSGENSTPNESFDVNADGAPPTTEAHFANTATFRRGNTIYCGPDLIFELHATDSLSGIKQTYYSENGGEFTEYTGSFDKYNKERAYSYRYYSIDKVGNVEPARDITFITDLSAPETAYGITGEHHGDVLSPRAKIQLSATDNLAGISEITYQIGDGPARRYNSGPIRLSGLTEGEHTISFFAEDNVGNTEQPKSVEFYLDKSSVDIQPSITGNHYVRDDLMYLARTAEIQLSAEDNKAGIDRIEYRIDDSDPRQYEGPISFAQLAGSHTLIYYGTDIIGNTSAEHRMELFIDDEPTSSSHAFGEPQFSPGDQLYIHPTTSFSIYANDDQSGVHLIYYSVNSGSYHRYTEPVTFSRPGPKSVRYYAVDRVGNRGQTRTAECIVDDAPPQISVSYSTKPKTDPDTRRLLLPPEASVVLRANEGETDIRRFVYTINKGDPIIYRHPIQLPTEAQDLTLDIYAVDQLGNSNSELNKITINTDLE